MRAGRETRARCPRPRAAVGRAGWSPVAGACYPWTPVVRPLDRALPLLVGLLALAVQLPIYDRWYALLDEGYALAVATDILDGRVLYRDVYVDAPFPGAFYLLAAAFALAGPSVWVSRVLAVVVFALFAALVTRLAQLLLARAGVVAVAISTLSYRVWAFPHWQLYNYSPLAATAMTGAVVLVAAHLARRTTGTLLAAGVAAAAGILCKQDYGLAVTGALGLFLLLLPWVGARPAAGRTLTHALGPATAFSLGVGLGLLPAFGALWAAGALPALVEQTILVPLRGASAATYTRLPPLALPFLQNAGLRADVPAYFPSILLSLRWNAIADGWAFRRTGLWDTALLVVYYAPIACFAAAALAWGTATVRRLRADGAAGARDERRLLLLAWAGGFLLAFNRPHDWVHLMMIFPPTLVVGGVLVAQAAGRLPRPLVRTAGALGVLALAALAASSVELGAALRRDADHPLPGPRGGVYAAARHTGILEDVLGWIDANAAPGAPVPVWPIQPMLSFLAGRDTVGGFHIIWPFQGGGRDERIIADLEARQVEHVVYSLSHYPHLGSVAANAPKLYDHLVDHYAMVATFNREPSGLLAIALRRRRPEAAPAVALLDVLPDGAGGTRARWPFARVLAVPTAAASAPTPVRVPVRVPPDRPVLRFAAGVNPDRWLWLGRGPFRFTVAVDGRVVHDRTMHPGREVGDRRWDEAEVDLTPWAGREVTIAFAVTAEDDGPSDGNLVGFAEPRVVVRHGDRADHARGG